QERVGDRLTRRDRDDVTAGAGRANVEAQIAEPRRTIEVETLEGFAACESDPEPVELFRRHGQELDLGSKRLIESRLELDVAESERPRAERRSQQQRGAPLWQ